MPNSHIPLVNQKLANASALLVMAQDLGKPQGAQQVIGVRALLESAMLQLHQGYIFYLRELGENYGLKGRAQIVETTALVSALEASGKSAAEAAELAELQKDVRSWLAQLGLARAGFGISPDLPKEQKAFGDETAIRLVDITQVHETPAALTLEQLLAWQSSFRALVLRQRETSAEY